jgi:uncharacterized protein YeeX (DUF496 family)
MTKETLKTFINKYYLGGTVESVKWIANTSNKQLVTNAITEDKNVLLKVTLNNFSELADGELGINDTSKLVKLLTVLTDEIKTEYNKSGEKISSIVFSDANTDVQYVTADLSVIPVAPPLKKVPPFTVEIPLDTDFISKFVTSKNALSDVFTFTLTMNKKSKLEMIIGYSSMNSNRIKLAVNAVDGKDTITKNISFNANHFKEILVANKDCTNAHLKVSEAGLASVEFVCGDITAEYYLVEVKSVD